MTTPPRPPAGPNKPHASRGEKVRLGKSDHFGGVGRGIGEGPGTRTKSIGMWLLVGLIVLFIFMDCIDKANAKKKSFNFESTSQISINEKL